jgi:tetratricopeptide (TPR) repeat protein
MAMDEGNEAVATLVRNALAASARSESEAAMTLLKRAIEHDDSAATPHYLLGAEYARIGIIDRAIDETRRAVDCDAGFADARFQLGMLHFTSGRLAEASSAWEALGSVETGHPLRFFAQGLLMTAQGRFAEAKALLSSGIAMNRANDALNADMRGVIEAIERAGTHAAADASAHVLLSAYRNSSPGSA